MRLILPAQVMILLALVLVLATSCLVSRSAIANDNFSATAPIGGTAISGVSGAVTGNNTGATSQTGEPVTAGAGSVNSIWYTWTAPVSGTVTFETCSATQTFLDTVIAGYTGNAVNALTQLAINDDTTGCATNAQPDFGSRITFNVVAGTAYHVQVDGYASGVAPYRLAWFLAAFTVTKTASVPTISTPGTITYTISVSNAGAVALSGLTISDALLLGATAKTLTSGPTLTSGDTNADGQIGTTETFVYTATYAVTQADINTGGTFSNTVTYGTAETPSSTSAAATTAIIQNPNFTIAKVQSAGANPATAAGQLVTYTITVANSGNITLAGPVLTDSLLLGASARTLTSGPTLTGGDGGTVGTLDVGETWIYNATYVVTQADFDAGSGSLVNTATFSTTLVAAKNSAVTTPLTRTPSLEVVKSWAFAPSGDLNSNGIVEVGDTVRYFFATRNNGNVTITNVSINDTFFGQGTPPVPGNEVLTTDVAPAGTSTDATGNNGIWSVLGVGDTVTFRADYLVIQADIDAG